MSVDAKRLYELLPAIHRVRDEALGGPVAALLEVVAEQVAVLEQDLRQLYDDQFIETCADWVVPYIADLIGYRPLHGTSVAVSSPRAEVANTIPYRRRKGTAAMLEQMAADVTGWDVRAVEFFEWLAWNQYMQHMRVGPPRGGTLDLREHDACERVQYADGAFDTSAHGIDVRRIGMGLGRYGPRTAGLFVWRLRCFHVVRGDARELADGFTFHPVGLDTPLFNIPESEPELAHLSGERNVPAVLRRRPLYDELTKRRSPVPGQSLAPVYFGARPVFEIHLDGDAEPVPPEEVLICDLAEWHAPPKKIDGKRIRVAVDPVLGRLTLAEDVVAGRVQVSYAYGCPSGIGGGPYDRLASLAITQSAAEQWHVEVSKAHAPIADERFATLAEAIEAWNALPAGASGVITILDSASYTEDLTAAAAIRIPRGSRLILAAANEARPHVIGDISVTGTATASAEDRGELRFNGVLVEGKLGVLVGNLGALTVEHCTIVPAAGRLQVNASGADKGNVGMVLSLRNSQCGVIDATDARIELHIEDSIVHNGTEDDIASAVEAPQATAQIFRATIIGATSLMQVEARNSIFTGLVSVARRQIGCVGFSYLPMESRSPRRHRCQPDLELEMHVARATRVTPVSDAQRASFRAEIESWLRPTFTSRAYGPPGFGQLRLSAPVQVLSGADDEAEMGAFHDLFQPQRQANLQARLEEYLRCGFEAGVIFVT